MLAACSTGSRYIVGKSESRISLQFEKKINSKFFKTPTVRSLRQQLGEISEQLICQQQFDKVRCQWLCERRSSGVCATWIFASQSNKRTCARSAGHPSSRWKQKTATRQFDIKVWIQWRKEDRKCSGGCQRSVSPVRWQLSDQSAASSALYQGESAFAWEKCTREIETGNGNFVCANLL